MSLAPYNSISLHWHRICLDLLPGHREHFGPRISAIFFVVLCQLYLGRLSPDRAVNACRLVTLQLFSNMAETRGICFCLEDIKPGEDTAFMQCGCGGMHAAWLRQWKESHLSLIQEHWTGPGPDPPVSILLEDVPCPYCKMSGKELMAIEASLTQSGGILAPEHRPSEAPPAHAVATSPPGAIAAASPPVLWTLVAQPGAVAPLTPLGSVAGPSQPGAIAPAPATPLGAVVPGSPLAGPSQPGAIAPAPATPPRAVAPSQLGASAAASPLQSCRVCMNAIP